MRTIQCVIVVAALALSACRAETVYLNPAIGDAENDRNHSYCQAYAEAQASGQNFNLYAAPWLARSETEAKWFKLCMLERGYQPVTLQD